MADEPTDVVMVGEYGTDPDEIASAILAAYLTSLGYLNPLAVIGNHANAIYRAQNIKYVLSSLGLPQVPVGMGEHGFGASSPEFETDLRYLAPSSQLHRGRPMLKWTLQCAEDNSVVLVLNSGFTDAVWLWMDDPKLFRQKVREVVIMGGVEVAGEAPKLSSEGFLLPSIGKGGAANNNFDQGATLHLYDLLQRFGIPMIVTTRHAAGACKLPFSFYREIAESGHPVAVRLNEKQAAAIRLLWLRANEPEGTPLRGELPLRCDRSWFVVTFCGGQDPGIGAGRGVETQSGDEDDIVPYIISVSLYDAVNLLFAVPQLRGRFGVPRIVEVGSVEHSVYGLTETSHGVKFQDSLRTFMAEGMNAILRSNNRLIGKVSLS